MGLHISDFGKFFHSESQQIDEAEAIEERILDEPVQMEQGIFETSLELDVGEQQEIGHGDPDLGEDGVFRGSEERFDFEMLFDPFEEEFHLPAGFIDLSDRPSGKREVVG